MKNHGGNGPFKCSVCNFTADIKQSLTVHEMNHHIPPLANSMDIERTIDDTPPENMNIFDMVSSFHCTTLTLIGLRTSLLNSFIFIVALEGEKFLVLMVIGMLIGI